MRPSRSDWTWRGLFVFQGPVKVPDDRKLAFYKYFKQATEGNIKSAQPYFFNVVERAKWDAWWVGIALVSCLRNKFGQYGSIFKGIPSKTWARRTPWRLIWRRWKNRWKTLPMNTSSPNSFTRSATNKGGQSGTTNHVQMQSFHKNSLLSPYSWYINQKSNSESFQPFATNNSRLIWIPKTKHRSLLWPQALKLFWYNKFYFSIRIKTSSYSYNLYLTSQLTKIWWLKQENFDLDMADIKARQTAGLAWLSTFCSSRCLIWWSDC